MNAAENRGWWVFLCVAGAAVLLLCGWLVPAHLRAVDASVLQRAGENRPSLVDRGLALEKAGNADAARLLLQAAQDQKIPWTGELASALATHSGGEYLYPGGPESPAGTPVTALVIRLENRDKVLAYLEANGSPAVQELLRARELTNTVLFTPSSSPSGQAFDAAVSVCGLLLAGNHLAPGLRDAVVERAAFARTSPDARKLEEVLLDLMSLGQRMNWGQLTTFVRGVEEPQTLDRLADQARNAGTQLPTLFAAVVLSRQPDRVAAYLSDYSQTGLTDIGASLRYGEGGLAELLQSHQRLHTSPLRERWTASAPLSTFARAVTDYAWRGMNFALILKWFFYVSAGFLLASAGHLTRWAEIEEPLRVRGFHLAREMLFALGFLLVVLLLSEPFLAQDSQKAQLAFRLRLPLAGAAIQSTIPSVKPKIMETPNMAQNLITVLLFFVLQGLIYTACVVKLAEIRRQKVAPRVKLKLLENEEHLFDAGLYLGFVGTIICLILVSLAQFKFSLMAAYSCTSFGIIFVSAFKIFNLRPARRRLLMQAEAAAPAPEPSVANAPSLAGV